MPKETKVLNISSTSAVAAQLLSAPKCLQGPPNGDL